MYYIYPKKKIILLLLYIKYDINYFIIYYYNI